MYIFPRSGTYASTLLTLPLIDSFKEHPIQELATDLRESMLNNFIHSFTSLKVLTCIGLPSVPFHLEKMTIFTDGEDILRSLRNCNQLLNLRNLKILLTNDCNAYALRNEIPQCIANITTIRIVSL